MCIWHSWTNWAIRLNTVLWRTEQYRNCKACNKIELDIIIKDDLAKDLMEKYYANS